MMAMIFSGNKHPEGPSEPATSASHCWQLLFHGEQFFSFHGESFCLCDNYFTVKVFMIFMTTLSRQSCCVVVIMFGFRRSCWSCWSKFVWHSLAILSWWLGFGLRIFLVFSFFPPWREHDALNHFSRRWLKILQEENEGRMALEVDDETIVWPGGSRF